MKPALDHGQIMVGSTARRTIPGTIVIAMRANKEIVKRVIHENDHQVWLEGDNVAESTDSRNFGWINKSDILGHMKHTLPLAQDPPKVRNRRGSLFGWVAAGILIIFSLVHLFRIDTFVPELAMVFDGNQTLTLCVAALLVSMQVFALPFLMRMRLSPLAQYVSGGFAVLVPLFWLLVAVWTYGSSQSTAQLGEFVDVPSSAILILVNLVWLTFSYYTIWALGYDNRPETKYSFADRLFARLSK